MFTDKEASLKFWKDPAFDKPKKDEFLVIVLPLYIGIGYIDEDGDIHSDGEINGYHEGDITYWADLPEYPNAYD